MAPEGDPQVNADSGGGPASEQGGDGVQLSEEQVGEIVGKVRESFGLKEDQRIDRMISGATRKAVGEALNLSEGQKFSEVIGNVISDKLAEMKVPESSGKSGKPDANAELKAELEAVKKVTQEYSQKYDAAQEAAYSERRKGLVRDALGEFDINPSVRPLITRGFLAGIEADPQIAEDGETLTVKDAEGDNVAFGTFLKGYFTENKSLLNSPKFGGSGASGGNSSQAPAGGFDFKKSSGKELVKNYATAAEGNSEQALETLKDQNKQRAKSLGMPS